MASPAVPATPAVPAKQQVAAAQPEPAAGTAPVLEGEHGKSAEAPKATPAVPATPATPATPAAPAKAPEAEHVAAPAKAPAQEQQPQPAKPEPTDVAKPSPNGEPRTANGERQPAQPQPKAPTPEVARASVPAAEGRQPAQPTQPAAPAAPTAPAAAASRPAMPATPVRLPDAPQAVQNTIRIAQARGVTHARLALRPAELGGVEIQLRSTADGLVARVTADSHQSAQVLQHAAADLRSQLQAQGIELQRLDIGTAGDPGHGSGAGAAEERRANPDGRRHGGSGAEHDTAAETQAGDTIELPDGVLVDVLA